MEEITKAYAWQEAIELSKRLIQLVEEFSDTETNVVVWHLRQAVVDIPASVAADLQAGRAATMEPIIKLAAELELVRKIYPAVDTTTADEAFATLLARLQGDNFSEREPEPEEEEAEVAEPEAPVEPAPAPAPAPVIPNIDGVSSSKEA